MFLPTGELSIYAPLLAAERSADILHDQVTDPAFEDKSRVALERFLKSQGLKVVECDREFYKPDKSMEKAKRNAVIEWDGFWTDGGRLFYVLECKHFISGVFSHLHALY
jgi:predicted nuclease of restriction endonuclease-like RecB superfamily